MKSSDLLVEFVDRFSDGAEDYARYRPTYPDALYEHIVAQVTWRERCWDVGTGSGQAANALARYFDEVIATDGSSDQLAQASPHPRVAYRCEIAERTSLPSASVDLVTAAAALHWFDIAAFYREVRRVARPEAVLAVWTYGTRVEISLEIDAIVDRYANEVLRPYWSPKLDAVRAGYRTLPFPFPEIDSPPLAIAAKWTLQQLVGKLNTWLAAVAYRKHHGHPATDVILEPLAAVWSQIGPSDTPLAVRLPLHLKLGKIA